MAKELPALHDTLSNLPLVALQLEDGALLELRGKTKYVIGRRGRSGENMPDIDLRDTPGGRTVSRRHAMIHVSAEGVHVEDLDSRNLTLQNGCLLLPHQLYLLAHDDELCVGSVPLLVRLRGYERTRPQ